MNIETTYCRICSSRCGLLAHIDGDKIIDFKGDSTDPVGAGHICEMAERSVVAMQSPNRITEPMKRINGTLTPVSWDTAIHEISEGLRKVRAAQGPAGLGIYLGEGVQRSSRTLIRSLAFGVGSGTPHIFSEQCLSFGPQVWATEQMIGHPASLLSDLGRAHYIVLLSGEQRDLGWGPLNPGMGHEAWIQHSRKTKGTKVIVADPRRTELAESMDMHLPIRPGTEPYLLLGMLAAIVRGGWVDTQFIRDYTINFDRLEQSLSAWSVEACAEICGIDAPSLSGMALKFSRSPMAVIHPARQSFQNEAGALGAWAWLALHAVTANILRPGGLYENRGAVDLFPFLSQIPSNKGPTTATTDHSLLLMQAPATAWASEVLDGPLRAMITVGGNPLGRLPNPKRTQDALAGLDLLVCIGHEEDETALAADWVLPAAHSWEQASIALHDNTLLPTLGTMWSTALSSPRQQARPEEEILRDLYAGLRPGMRGSAWGRHLGLIAQYIVRADLEEWEHRALSWSDTLDLNDAAENERRLNVGHADRSTWRPTTESGRIDVVPDAITEQLRRAQPPQTPTLSLRTGQWRDRAADVLHPAEERRELEVRLHPDQGFKEGARVLIKTAHGECAATVCHDDRLRDDVIDLPFEIGTAALELLDSTAVDPLTGSAVFDGITAEISTL
jgi:anaerobic selenocysteine-containing dehydrogenase